MVSRARELRAQPWVSASAGVRVAMMFTAGVVVGITVGLGGQWPYAPLCGWDAAVIVFTLWGVDQLGHRRDVNAPAFGLCRRRSVIVCGPNVFQQLPDSCAGKAKGAQRSSAACHQEAERASATTRTQEAQDGSAATGPDGVLNFMTN